MEDHHVLLLTRVILKIVCMLRFLEYARIRYEMLQAYHRPLQCLLSHIVNLTMLYIDAISWLLENSNHMCGANVSGYVRQYLKTAEGI